MDHTEVATLAGGCFWCVEAVFELVEGVDKVVSGYTGGHTIDPTYEEVCSGATGHAEVIQVTFDSLKLNYTTVLEIFFAYHDPTTLNRQGNDIGTQYRSAIYCHDDEQESIAKSVISMLEADKVYPDPIVTEVSTLGTFFECEDYHQSFFQNNPYQPYCQFIIAPKVTKLREKHSELLRTEIH
ncbi:MAG: peptide-methionine (S)-S-oxide reductase MsrA [SAR202 cluster bacterium]|jgi:peptide-methionine (S)-S-oxide reductase|nr:peptide-methionine (S)-S-oxide reductase MsrA [SAR202 cluster bacterium]